MRNFYQHILIFAVLWNVVAGIALAILIRAGGPSWALRAIRPLAWVSILAVFLTTFLYSTGANAQQVDVKQMVFGPSCLCEVYKKGKCMVGNPASSFSYLLLPPTTYVSEYCANGKPVTIVAILYLAKAYDIAAVFVYETR